MAAGAKVFYEFGPFRVDPDKQVLLRENRPVPITPKAFDTLLILVRHSREVVSKDELMKTVWPDAFVEEGNLSQNIFMLRKALGDTPEDRRYIVTLPGRGYRFTAQVRTVMQDGEDLVIQSLSRSQMVVEQTDSAPGETLKAPATVVHWKLSWKYVLPIAALFTLVVSAALFLGRRHPNPLDETHSVLVGDFNNTTGDPVFDGALREGLRLKLTESPYLNVVPEAKLRSALKEVGQAEFAGVSPAAVRSICRRLGGAVVLSGRVARETIGVYRVQLTAADCLDGNSIAHAEVRAASRDDVLPALGRAADALRKSLGESEASVQQFRTPMVQASTNSLAALKVFSTGEDMRALGHDYETIPLYKMASDLDPAFALAYARLGTIYSNAQEVETSQRFFAKAFELREHASERERLYITAHYYAGAGETDKLLQVYQLWRQLYPRDLVPANNLVEVYFTFGELQKAVETAREAVHLGPDNSFPYANLIRAYQMTGQFAEAKAVYDDVVARKLDGIVAHIERYVVAFAEHDDAEMQRQLVWAKGKPQEGELLNEAAWAAMGRGQMRSAHALFTQAEQIGLKNGLPQFAANCWREYSQSAAAVELSDQARSSINKASQLAPESRELGAFAAFVFANSGDLRRADELANRIAQQVPSDFAINKIVLPTARAVAGLHRQAPDAALRELQMVEPYDLSWTTQLAPIYYRGLAYLQLQRPAEAGQQFHKLLDHWTLRPESIYVALAHLGLAHAHVLAADKSNARSEYEKFFVLWKDADPDIPILRRAKTEYAKLR